MSPYGIVAIGGSWGGMDAVIAILEGLGKDFPLPLVLVLHRQRDEDSQLVAIVSRLLTITVKEIDEKEKLLPGVLYVAPRNYHVLLEEDKSFSLCASENVNFARPSIDVVFESIALAYREKTIGILLTGANSDGSKGLKTISEMGGLTIVQNPDDAVSSYMPLSALRIMNPSAIFTKQEINKFLKSLLLKS